MHNFQDSISPLFNCCRDVESTAADKGFWKKGGTSNSGRKKAGALRAAVSPSKWGLGSKLSLFGSFPVQE